MSKLVDRIKSRVNYWFFREYRFRRIVRRHLDRFYNDTDPEPPARKTIVYMADGRRLHGGLADRLRGIVSAYSICKDQGWQFRINFTSPFRLERYLVPASYDWLLKVGELSFNRKWSHAVFQDTRGDVGEREKRWQRKTALKQFSLPFRQIHVYTAFYHAEDRFGDLFNELFRPAPDLQRALDQVVEQCGPGFVSVTTRFCELLGDFKEPVRGRDVLSDDDAERLIESLLAEIKRLHDRKQVRILVTSDSRKFLERVKNLDYCVVIPGEISHIDNGEPNDDADFKTFLDFMTISKASESYLLLGPGMYNGNFAKRASAAGRHPYIIKKL